MNQQPIVWINDRQVPFSEFVAGLVGLPCWNAALSYGGELYLDFGEHRRYQHGPMAGKEFGAWQLFTRGTPWRLATNGDAVDDDSDRLAVRRALASLPGHSVESLHLAAFDSDLRLLLSGNVTLAVLTTACPGDEPDVACWELYREDGLMLAVLPGAIARIEPFHST